MTESASSEGKPEALHELQAKLLQSQQIVKDKDVQLARVADKMREFKGQLAQDKKTASEHVKQLESKLEETVKALEAERERNRVMIEQKEKVSETSEVFSVDDKPVFAVEENGETRLERQEKESPARLQELEELRFQVDNLVRQNELLTSELSDAKSLGTRDLTTPTAVDAEAESTLARRTGERDECRADNARLAKKVKELLKGQQNMQTLQQSLRTIEEDRNNLRNEFAKAQSDWLSQEQQRMESFKVMLREAEEQGELQREKSKAEIDSLQSERQALRNKIYQEFADQLQAKTELIAEFDGKLQQCQRRERDSENKLSTLRQQLQESAEQIRKHTQTIRELEKEKEKLLQETHAVQTSLDAKCTQLHQQVQQLQKRLKDKEHTPIEVIEVGSNAPLVSLRAKHQLAKKETLRLLDELGEAKKRASEQQAELKLEICKYKSALSELQKFLRLDVFSGGEIELEIKKPEGVELQGMEMEEEHFGEASQGALEEHVSALVGGCDQVLSLLSELQRALEDKQDEKNQEDEESKSDRVLQQTKDQLSGVKSHAIAIAKCVTDVSHYHQELGDNLLSLSARLCDEASCALGLKMIFRAILKTCGASRTSSKKYKYAPLPKT